MTRKAKGSKTYIELTSEMARELAVLKERSGYGYIALYTFGKNTTDHPVFKTTTSQLPYSWEKQLVKTVNVDDYVAIIETYKSLAKQTLGRTPNKEAIPDELRAMLAEFIASPRQTSLEKILKFSNAPRKLTPILIGKIASGETASAKPEYIEYLEDLVQSQQDR